MKIRILTAIALLSSSGIASAAVTPFFRLAENPPVVVGYSGGGTVDWVQASPDNGSQFYFSENITGWLWKPTLTFGPNGLPTGSVNGTGTPQSALQSPQRITDVLPSGITKGGGVYDANTVFVPAEQSYSAHGGIGRVNLSGPNTTSVAWNFNTQSVPRADLPSSDAYWPEDLLVDRANNKLFIGSTYDASNSEGTSVARFSINPTTKALTYDGWNKAITPNGSKASFHYRQTLLSDGYLMMGIFDYDTFNYNLYSYDGYGSASGNGTLELALAGTSGTPQAMAFRANPDAPSGLGYLYIGYRQATDTAYDGKIYAYDYLGAGDINTTPSAIFDVNAAATAAGLWSGIGTAPRMSSISFFDNGSLLVGFRAGAGTSLDGRVLMFGVVPESSTIMLFGLGGLLLRRWHRRRA